MSSLGSATEYSFRNNALGDLLTATIINYNSLALKIKLLERAFHFLVIIPSIVHWPLCSLILSAKLLADSFIANDAGE